MTTNCDVCNKTHYCARTGRIYKDPDGHWQIELHTICLIDEEVENKARTQNKQGTPSMDAEKANRVRSIMTQ